METTTQKSNKRFIMPAIIGVVALVLLVIGVKKIIYGRSHEDTDNAQVEANISPMSPKISGYVTTLNISDNQPVKKGDTLLIIDERELMIRVTQADIALANAEANLAVLKSNVGTASASAMASNTSVYTAEANVDAAKVRVWKAQQDYDRYKKLFELNSVTQQQFDNAKAEKEAADKALEVAMKQMQATKSLTGVSSSQLTSSERQIRIAELTVEQRKTELEMAKLQLSYAYVIAPMDGIVSKKNVQPGQLVAAGAPLFSIVDESMVWVNANFKETQIEKMKVGQHVDIAVDAYDDKTFSGTIASISSATGAKFSLLPPDNATGNFVKVVQRIPVKITLDQPNKGELVLRAGMNVKATVNIK
jgi:membrane fusion protein (multidrug efflux system)